MLEQWVVLLEVATDGSSGEVGADEVGALLEALNPGPWGGALQGSDRYALQVTATGTSPPEALIDVLSRWAVAVRLLDLSSSKVVRTEVFTPEELEREFEGAGRGQIPLCSPDAGEDDEVGYELVRQAFSDPLTGLLGREAFTHRLEAALAGAGAGRRAAVLSVDLDGFRSVNDRFGDASADVVLIAVAQRLAASLRPGDTLARFGGDDYGVLLEDTTEEGALAVAGRLLDALRRPVVVYGQEFTPSASAGVALWEEGDDGEAVVRKAKAALGLAKGEGGGRHVLYTSDASVASRPARSSGDFCTGDLQDRLAHLLLTQEAAVAANEAETLDQAAQVVMRQICAHVSCDVGHLWVSDATAEGLGLMPLWHLAHPAQGVFAEAADKLPVQPGAGPIGRVLVTGHPVWIPDLADEADFAPKAAAVVCGLRSAFAFPVLVGDEVVAVLEFFTRARTEPTGSFLDVAAAIGIQLGRVVERQRAVAAMRRSQAQLRASERRLREAQAMACLGSWHFDLRTGESNWSEGMEAIYGVAPGEVMDLESTLGMVHTDDRAQARAALSRLVETGERSVHELRILRRDGGVRWVCVHAAAVRDENGVVVGIEGTSQDITDRKRAEEALRDRERQLAEAQRTARLGGWERDLSSGQLKWSEETYGLWGWEPGSEVTFAAFLATVHADDRQALLDDLARLCRTEEPRCLDFRARVAGGRERWFRGGAQVLRDDNGTQVKVFGTIQDVTEQKQVEEELRTAKESYQRIVETAHEGILTVDSRNITTFVNPRMAQILGYSVEEMTGMPASAFVDEETYASLAEHRKRRRAGVHEHYYCKLRAKDGSVVAAGISASPLFDDGGEYVGALAMVTDMSAVREAEEIVRAKVAEGLEPT